MPTSKKALLTLFIIMHIAVARASYAFFTLEFPPYDFSDIAPMLIYPLAALICAINLVEGVKQNKQLSTL